MTEIYKQAILNNKNIFSGFITGTYDQIKKQKIPKGYTKHGYMIRFLDKFQNFHGRSQIKLLE